MYTNSMNLNQWMQPTPESPSHPRPSPIPLEVPGSRTPRFEMLTSYSRNESPLIQNFVIPNSTVSLLAGAKAFAWKCSAEQKREENFEEVVKEEEMDPFLRGMKIDLSLEM